jgi:ribosomal-protein-alanine N-acetyltransferase
MKTCLLEGGSEMEFKVVPMKEEYAGEMINTWKYEGEYSIYDYSNEEEAEALLQKELWGKGKFAVLDEKKSLVGELTIECFEEVPENSDGDGFVDIETIINSSDKVYEMWIGFGLRPDLTGKGLGKEFVLACVNFAVKHLNYKGEYVRLGVAEFNERARKAYEKAGFEVFNVYNGEISGKKLKVLWMKKEVKGE